MSAVKTGATIRMRIAIIAPPPGVSFAVQRGKDALLAPARTETSLLEFELSLRVGLHPEDGTYNFLGDFAQGPRADRFLYLNSGTYAWQSHTAWARRAKLKLAAIPAALVAEALASSQHLLEARVAGTGKDGGPICATVPPAAVEWRLTR